MSHNPSVPSAKLDTSSRFADPDAAFRALIEAHRGLSDAASAALNARLVLVLANHIGDHAVLAEALQLATAPPTSSPLPPSDRST
jgi:Protein of unknown function (DUF2783)